MGRRRFDRLLKSRIRVARHAARAAIAGDAKAIHELRVAARSLRRTLPALTRSEDRPVVQRVRQKLRAAIRLLGPIRDRDVGRLHLTSLPDDGAAGTAVKQRLISDSDRDRAIALANCRERWPRGFFRVLSTVARLPEPSTNRMRRRTLKLVRRSLKSAERAFEELDARPSSSRLHELRKRIRDLRYLLELSAEIGLPSKVDITSLKALQSELGDCQDLIVAARWCRGVGDGSPEVLAEARRLRARARTRLREFLMPRARSVSRGAAAFLVH